MWPVLLALLRRNAVFVTLPFAAVVGAIGYNLEAIISDRHTPSTKSIIESRVERQTDEKLRDPTNVEKLRLKEDVLERNLSPSLKK